MDGNQGTVTTASPIQSFVARVAGNIEHVIVGKRRQVEFLLVALLCRGHVLLEDVPGTGKTMLARATGISLGLSFNRLQCTPDLLPNDVTGFSLYNQQTGAFEFRAGPLLTNLLLVDEINRATPRTQSALLEAMQERQVTVDGVTHLLPDPFLLLATQNPIEFEGTFPLPEAQLDRFLLRLPLGYPGREDELRVLRNLRKSHPIEHLTPVADAGELLALYDLVTDIHVEPAVETYILDIIALTRSHPDLAVGASPRGSLALYKTAQALAGIRGRDFVTPDDVKTMAGLVLPHRLALSADSQLRGRTADVVVNEILAGIDLELAEEA